MQETTSVHKGMPDAKGRKISPWFWISSLYYAEGIPYIITMTVSVIMFKRFGISNEKIAFWTSILYLPWVIKPLWSPIVDIISTKRRWIYGLQFLMGVVFLAISLILHLPTFFTFSIIALWVLAFASATHDISADGFYLLGLTSKQQAWFVGVRSTFYRFAMLTGQGLIVILAGYIETHTGLGNYEFNLSSNTIVDSTTFFNQKAINGKTKILYYYNLNDIKHPTLPKKEKDTLKIYFRLSNKPEEDEIVLGLKKLEGNEHIKLIKGSRFTLTKTNWNKIFASYIEIPQNTTLDNVKFQISGGNVRQSWTITYLIIAIFFILIATYHKFILPYPIKDQPKKAENLTAFFNTFLEVFKSYFARKDIASILGFLLIYRLAESQLVKIASPFLLDGQDKGGLGLSTSQIGVAYGTVGLIALTVGGLLGGFLAARDGLKKWLLPMAIAINLPDIVYTYMSFVQPTNFFIINLCIGIEQLGYGFGFTAYMLFMIYVSQGKFETAHFAISTGIMALGMMLPGMISGYIQQLLGYKLFFIWIMIATIPAIATIFFIKVDPEFGKK